MADKITDFAPRVFGSGAGVAQIAEFGSLFAGAPATTTDPAVAQSLSNYLVGWLGAAIGGNAPAIEDMNAPFFVITTALAIIRQMGVAEWNAAISYQIGSFANVAGTLYVSLVIDNVNNAVTDVTKWYRFGSKLDQYTGSQTLALTNQMVEFDATSGPLTATLPAANATGAAGKKITITKTDASANPVVVSDGTFLVNLLGQYDSVTIFSNGSVWYAI